MRRTRLSRMLLVVATAVVAAVGLTSSATAQQTETVAYIATGPATVGSYNVTHTNAFRAMCQKYRQFECRIVDNVAYPNTVQTLTALASSGVKVIVVNSSGFAAGMMEVAPRFPHTWFVMTSDLDNPITTRNVAAFVQTWREFGYLGGVAAAHMSRTDKVGWVNGLPLSAARKMMGGFVQGARSVNKKTKVYVRFTNSFTDTSLAKQAALAEIAQGVDVLTGVAGGAQAGIIQAAEERKKMYIGYLADDYRSATCCTITSMTVDMKRVYDRIGNLYTNKKLNARLYIGTVKNRSIRLAPLRRVPTAKKKAVFAAKKKAILAVQARMKKGQINVADILYP